MYPGGTLNIESLVENPNSNLISAKLYLQNLEGTFLDSANLQKERSVTSSEVWAGEYQTPQVEDYFKVAICTYDSTEGERFSVSNVNRFTTVGPVILSDYDFTIDSTSMNIIPEIKNNSNAITISNSSIKFISSDPWVLNISPSVSPLPEILPGQNVNPDSVFCVTYIDSLFPGHFNFRLEIMIDGWMCWVDSMQIIITDIKDQKTVPLSYNLEQNYPNPFNPSTTIKYSIPEMSKVSLTIYNLLGEEVATLVNEEKVAGNYTVEFNAANLSSGIYFYQLKAGNFIQTKKMVLMK